MKTKITKFFMVLSLVVITIMMWTNTQAQCTFQLTASMDDSTITVNKCLTSCSQVVFYRPVGSYNNAKWSVPYPPYMIYNQDSIIVSASTNFSWEASGIGMTIHFYLLNTPTTPGFDITSTSCGVLDAGTNPGGTFAWSTGATNQTITVTTPDIYYVNKTNICGSTSDTTEITWGSTPVNIGPDTTLCYGVSLPLNAGGGISWLWSDGATTQTTTVDTTNIYWVAATANGCVLYDSLTANFTINTGEAIQVLTTDSLTGNNEIRWPNTNPDMVSTLIYRIDTTNYYLQDIVPYAQGVFVDTLSSIQRPYQYKISTLDGCGNESPLSLYHESISLGVVPLLPNGFRLEWTQYGIEGQSKLSVVAYYSVYSTNGYGGSWNPNPIITVGPNITQVNLPNSLDTFYGIEGGINTSKSILSVRSNLVENPTITGIPSIPKYVPGIFPNPVENYFYIKGIPDIEKIEIVDITGKVVQANIFTKSRIEIQNLAKGTYICNIIIPTKNYTVQFIKR